MRTNHSHGAHSTPYISVTVVGCAARTKHSRGAQSTPNISVTVVGCAMRTAVAGNCIQALHG